MNLGLRGLADGQPNTHHTLVPANSQGLVDPQAMLAAVTADTSLVHLQLCNHETGTIQPVGELAEGCQAKGVWLHSDAAQAAGHLEFSFADLGADFMSISSHKLGGPAGVGALLVKRGLRLEPLLRGGDQERARRAGLENLPGIAGFGAVCEFLGSAAAAEIAQQQQFSAQLTSQLASLEGVELLGPPAGSDRPASRPHQLLLPCTTLNRKPWCWSLTGKAWRCIPAALAHRKPTSLPPVLAAMGLDGHNSLRISVGWNTTQADVDALLQAVPAALVKLRSLKPS